MNDPRDAYRLIDQPPLTHSLVFIDTTTVTWFSAWTNTPNLVGRIDDAGMIVDIAAVPDDIENYERLAVMTSGMQLRIDADAPLLDLMPEQAWPSPFTGGWFVGDTLAKEPACGGKTLYRTTADGYGRVLPPTIELAEPMTVISTGVLNGPNIDSASTHRLVAIAVRCPTEYEGVQVFLLDEVIGYGDGGPRSRPFTRMLRHDPDAAISVKTESQSADSHLVIAGL